MRSGVFDLFADTDEFDRTACHFSYGERRTAAGISVEFCQDHAGDAERIVEVACNRDSLLAESGIRDKQNFRRRNRMGKSHQFLNHGGIDLESSCGIDDEIVAFFIGGALQSVFRDFADIHAAALGVDGNIDFLPENFELIDSCGPIDVACREHDFPSAFFELNC